MSKKQHPDYFRSPDQVQVADPRSIDRLTISPAGFRRKTIHDQHAAVAALNVEDTVPEHIRVQFETSKNLYLYAWFVYRFYPVSRTHAYACLELALRERLGLLLFEDEKQKEAARHAKLGKQIESKLPSEYAAYHPGLKRLLRYAVDKGYLKNRNFAAWRRKTELRARARRDEEMIRMMAEKQIDRLEIEDTPLEISPLDEDHDYVGRLVNMVPLLRNHYAHGASSLDSSVLGTLQMVSEAINQLFSGTQDST